MDVTRSSVAAGYRTPPVAVAKGWMASPGHRAIVNRKLEEIGVGYATNPSTTYRVYWTQDFGSRS